MAKEKSSNLIHVTQKNFDAEVVNSSVPVLIDFWAPWCGPCRAVGPVLEGLAEEFRGRFKVVKINVDDEPQLAGAFQVRSIPTLAVMTDKKVVDVQVGFGGQDALKQLFEKHALAGEETLQAVAV